MYHLLAFAESQGATATDDQLAAVGDDQFSRQSNNFQMAKDHWLVWAAAFGATMIRARLRGASLQQRGFPQIVPFNTALLPPNDPNVMDFRDYPVLLKREEDFRVDTSHTNAGAEVHTVLCGVWDKIPNFNVNHRDLRWLRATASVTAVANAWSNLGAITFQDNIEGGRWEIYGMQCQGAQVQAARLVLPDQAYRPGCIGQAALGSRSHKLFRGNLGPWGQFSTYALPQVQTLESGAGASNLELHILCAKADS